MNDLADRLQTPYAAQRMLLHRSVGDADEGRHQATPFAAAWPALEAHTRDQVFPCFHEKNKAMKAGMTEVTLRDLHRQKRRMKKLVSISWFNGWALKVRFLNFCYRLGILFLYLVLFALIAGFIYLVAILLRAFN